jgi:hypothetical protein
MNSLGVHLQVPGAFSPGTYMNLLSYTDGSGTTVTAGGSVVDIVQIGPVGGLVEGGFQATLPNGHTLSGKFEVCRLPDIDAP